VVVVFLDMLSALVLLSFLDLATAFPASALFLFSLALMLLSGADAVPAAAA
jgi:hypothetical protein